MYVSLLMLVLVRLQCKLIILLITESINLSITTVLTSPQGLRSTTCEEEVRRQNFQN